MSKQTSQNTFLDGIRGDSSPIDASSAAATDVVNGSLISNKGNQMTLQALKSNAPITLEDNTREVEVIYESTRNTSDSFIANKKVVKIEYQYDFEAIDLTYVDLFLRSPEGRLITSKRLEKVFAARTSTNWYELNVPGEELGRISTIANRLESGQYFFKLRVTYKENDSVVKLPTGNKIFGVKTHNNIAYIISGKETDTQKIVEDSNNKAEKPPIPYGNVIDNRDDINNTIYTTSGDSNYPPYKGTVLELGFGNPSNFFAVTHEWPGSGNSLGYIVRNLIPELKIEPGKYAANLDIMSKVDDFWTTLGGHNFSFAIRFGDTKIVRDWQTYSKHGEDIINKPGIRINFDLTQQDFDDSPTNHAIQILLKGAVRDVGLVNQAIQIDNFSFSETPFETTSSEVIDPIVASTSASSPIHSDGTLTIGKEDSGSAFFPTYYVALFNQPWVPVSEGSSHTFTGLPAGNYTYYIRIGLYTYRNSISVGAKELQDILVESKIKNFNSLQDFQVEVDFNDPYEEYSKSSSNQYRVGYTIYSEGEEIIGDSQVVNSYQEAVLFDVSMAKEGLVLTYVETLNAHVVDTVSTSFARRCEVELSITKDLFLNKYAIEVGTFPSPAYPAQSGELELVYKPLNNLNGGPFQTSRVTLTGNSYLDMEIQESYDDTVNIIFSEKGKQLRLINSGFSVFRDKDYEIINRSGVKDTNAYNENSVEVATRCVQSLSEIPEVSVEAVENSGGNLEVGSYKLYFKLGTPDGNETDFIEETGLIPIFNGDSFGSLRGGKPGSTTNKSIKVKISKVDSSYDYVSLYYVLNSGEEVNTAVAYKVGKRFQLPTSKIGQVQATFLFTGFEEKTVIDEKELSIKQSYLSSVKSITQIQNMLFTADVSNNALDYNKLFKAINKVIAVPSTGKEGVSLKGFYGGWDGAIENSTDLYEFSEKINGQTISTASVGDLNRLNNQNVRANLDRLISSEGFHNPLVAEKLTGYWPQETYKVAMCLIMDDNTITNPVPVLSGDFSDELTDTKTRLEWENHYYNDISNSEFIEGSESWLQEKDYNNIGVIRFPKTKDAGTLYYPKFLFKRSELMAEYPEVFSRVKGFFFVRAERKPDVILSGAIGQTYLAITEVNPLVDFEETGNQNVPLISEGGDIRSAVPLFNTRVPFDTGFESYSSVLLGRELFSAGLNAYLDILKITPGSSDFTSLIQGMYKYTFRSGDVLADTARAAASFNGNSYGVSPIANFNQHVSEYTSLASNASQVNYSQRYLRIMALQKMLRTTASTASAETVRGVFDFISHGYGGRSAGGFSGKIPFKASKFLRDDADLDPVAEAPYFPTGVFDLYLGLSSKTEIDANYAFLYPNVAGAISKEALKDMYSSDESTSYVAITPRYSFSDFKNENLIEIIGTRGDCYITQSILNVANTDTSPVGSQASQRPSLKNAESGEYNSYRALEAGSAFMINQHSNYLNFARHPKVEDAVESAKFNKARGFYPFDSKGNGLVVPGIDNKMPSTSGFNKGYGANFTGKKHYSVSKNSPFISSDNENTVQYSNQHLSGNFSNGYRNFSSLNKKDFNKDLGPIVKIENSNGNLLMVHTKGVALAGVNDQALIPSEQGTDVRIGSINVLGEKAKIISSEFGSEWFRSIKRTDNGTYGVDVNRNKIWFTLGDKLQMISTGAVNRILSSFLVDFQNKKEIPGELYIATHYNTITNDVIFTFYNANSNITKRVLEIDPDLFKVLNEMTAEERILWSEGTTPLASKNTTLLEETVNRKKILRRYDDVIDNEIVKNLTLVYNEDTKVWSSRLSYSPEFAFNIKNKLYSINNVDASASFAPFMDNIIESDDKNSHIIWEHDRVSEETLEIPLYSSFYGKLPEFEFEFIINDNVKFEKLLETLQIVGNEVEPDKVIYEISEHAPWLKTLIDTDGNNYENWEAMKEDFLRKSLDSTKDVINPARYYEQDLYDRRSTSILRANYIYDKGYGEIKVGKNLHTMYNFNTDGVEDKKHYLTKLRDKYFKIRLSYTKGRGVYVKAITSEYKISN